LKANKGDPGTGRNNFRRNRKTTIEKQGLKEWPEKLARELREKTCKPGAVRRVNIPKGNGKTGPLGIPNLKDRVVQMVAGLVLGPIFEADLPEEQHACREGKDAKEAVRKIRCLINRDHHPEVADADLSG
jgi:retron-type reverse transcriptase